MKWLLKKKKQATARIKLRRLRFGRLLNKATNKKKATQLIGRIKTASVLDKMKNIKDNY